MSLRKESTGTVEVCDGCGRTDAGPGTAIDVEAVPVYDPNVGGTVQHHYCPNCRANLGLSQEPLVISSWAPPTPGPGEGDASTKTK